MHSQFELDFSLSCYFFFSFYLKYAECALNIIILFMNNSHNCDCILNWLCSMNAPKIYVHQRKVVLLFLLSFMINWKSFLSGFILLKTIFHQENCFYFAGFFLHKFLVSTTTRHWCVDWNIYLNIFFFDFITGIVFCLSIIALHSQSQQRNGEIVNFWMEFGRFFFYRKSIRNFKIDFFFALLLVCPFIHGRSKAF